MIVVAIIALLVAIAVPAFMNARKKSQNTRFINDLRVATNAFETYAAEHPTYPPDVGRGVVPSGMAVYFGQFDFTAPTAIGGNWDWDYNVFGFTAGVSVVAPTAGIDQLQQIDERIDNGDLSTGAFRSGSGRYTFVIE